MIGMSLSYKHLVSTDDPALKPETLFPQLLDHGVRSVELRMVSRTDSPEEVLRVANLLWDYGFQITVHSTGIQSLQTVVEDVFTPLTTMIENIRQRELIITLHPIDDDNAALLVALSDYINDHKYPVRIALENKRNMPDGSRGGDCMLLVLDAVKQADRKNVGICFDMGHYAWYTANFTDEPNRLPPKEFLSKTIHTHIHTYVDGTTHFPLDEWREPCSLYIDALGHKYLGVYNFELSPKRFSDRWSATEAYLLSADTFQKNCQEIVPYHDTLRLYYDKWFQNSMQILHKKEGCYGTLLAPSSYLFSTNGYPWAMDIAFLELIQLAKSPSLIKKYLGNIKCMILTHAHVDHFEKRTVRALCDTDITWVVPHFMLDRVLNLGVRRERIVSVRAGDVVSVGPLSIRVLAGRHFRPVTKKGIDAVGYFITAKDAPSIAFPGDVRDFGTPESGELDADHCFAHVWLGDEALDPESYLPQSKALAEFMLKHSRRSILLTHLFSNRSSDKRWTLHHAAIVNDAICERSPETTVSIPRYGEIFDLSFDT